MSCTNKVISFFFSYLFFLPVYPRPILEHHYDSPRFPECDPSDFACSDGMCLSGIYVCDGNVDCPDANDEKPEACREFNYYIYSFTGSLQDTMKEQNKINCICLS